MIAAPGSLVLQGFVLGWSVAWAPGPINVELVRRALARGFFAAYAVALGASSGDACWAMVSAFATDLVPQGGAVRAAMGVVSVTLLVALAIIFLRAAWRSYASDARAPSRFDNRRAGYALGLGMALTSPWNMGFWLAVMGRPDLIERGIAAALVLAASVVAGALSWCLVLVGTVTRLRFSGETRWWEVASSGLTGLLMLYFAVRGIVRLAGG